MLAMQGEGLRHERDESSGRRKHRTHSSYMKVVVNGTRSATGFDEGHAMAGGNGLTQHQFDLIVREAHRRSAQRIGKTGWIAPECRPIS